MPRALSAALRLRGAGPAGRKRKAAGPEAEAAALAEGAAQEAGPGLPRGHKRGEGGEGSEGR